MTITTMVGFSRRDVGKIVTLTPSALRWPWWAMFPRREVPQYRIKAVTARVATVRRRKRGWL